MKLGGVLEVLVFGAIGVGFVAGLVIIVLLAIWLAKHI